MANFRHVLIFKHSNDGGIGTNIKVVNFFALMKYGGLFQGQIIEHLVCLRVDSAFTFQRVKFGIIGLMKIKQTPFSIGIHYMAHRTNLVM
jgi:hypothetical protein